MSLIELFMSTEGRINRLRFWIGILVLGAVSTAAMVLILAILGASRSAILVSVVVGFALAYPTYALMAKRFHDRDKPGLLALIGIVPAYTVNLLYTFRVLGLDAPTALTRILDVVLVLISLWILVELGYLKGTAGPNRYGPDPLGQAEADATLR